MKLTTKELIKLKTKLALEGSGAKGRLANKLGIKASQLTLILDTSKCPDKASKELIKYINS